MDKKYVVVLHSSIGQQNMEKKLFANTTKNTVLRTLRKVKREMLFTTKFGVVDWFVNHVEFVARLQLMLIMMIIRNH